MHLFGRIFETRRAEERRLQTESETRVREFAELHWQYTRLMREPNTARQRRALRERIMNLRSNMTHHERWSAMRLARVIPDDIVDTMGYDAIQGTPIHSRAVVQGEKPIQEESQTSASSSSAQASTANQTSAIPSRLHTVITVNNPVLDGFNSRLMRSSGVIPRPRGDVEDEEEFST